MPHQLQEKTIRYLEHQHGAYINGQPLAEAGSEVLELINPSEGKAFATCYIADDATVRDAVESAREALNASVWGNISPAEREKLLHGVANYMEEDLAALAELVSMETGKLFAQAKSEVAGAVATFRYYAGWCTKLEGETMDISLRQKPGKKNFAFTRREPVGVVAAIVPWNFPVSIACWKLAPALAAGCTVVLKPSEQTPLSSLYLADLFTKAGLPPGVLNVVCGKARTGSALTSDENIDKITFTGSTQVGRIIGQAAMQNLTDVSLELGGKSPAIVFQDADLSEAANGVALGIFRNSGQVCVAGSRAYVQESILDEFLEAVRSEAAGLKIGGAFDSGAELGPLSSKDHLEKVCSYVREGMASANHVFGGKRLDRNGYYMEPAIFRMPGNDSKLISDEIFGPVLSVISFKDPEEAVRMANDSWSGLSSTVWTRDIGKALECVNRLNAGWVFVNGPARSDPAFPIGGFNQSGIGKELGKVGLYAYTRLKSVNIIY